MSRANHLVYDIKHWSFLVSLYLGPDNRNHICSDSLPGKVLVD